MCSFMLSFVGIMVRTLVDSAATCQADVLQVLIYIGIVSTGGAILFQLLAMKDSGSDVEWISLGAAGLIVNLLQIGALIVSIYETMKAFQADATCFGSSASAIYLMMISASFFVIAVLGNVAAWL
eukprot:CAMPEP_0178373090 /NCGR_PEP_ID=MMETSP0689_2-20121128/1686_1 /TAXON_ID=160604 /ORGANISM="Amphidinium massartii, Strain CS-259" /LENGTH=124 /DNA_ID=CAMNT_0019993027 /DNA_START=190 /DNA_END=561 /DNA_ORIENTATION=+